MNIQRIDPKDARITILTKEQAEKLPHEILKKRHWWWLRSPYGSRSASIVGYGGWANSNDVCYPHGGVVPAFVIDNPLAELNDKVYVGKLLCTVIGANLVLSDGIVCRHRYDATSSNWENSELKAFIESDEFAERYILGEFEDSVISELHDIAKADHVISTAESTIKLANAVLDLVNDYKTDIEKLKEELADARYLNTVAANDAVKEFAEKLKIHRRKMSSSDFSGEFWDTAVLESDIDKLVKEMTEV